MNDIKEIKRLPSPAPLPQALAWDESKLWMGSLDTKRIYRLNPESLDIEWETQAPGYPFGITIIDGELRVLCGETDEDNRIIRRCTPGKEFDSEFALPCPDDTGSQLGYDGKHLHVSQWYNQLVLTIDQAGEVLNSVKAPHGICGQVIVDGVIYLQTTDDEESNDYFLTRIDPRGDKPVIEDIATVPFPGRSLAFDGTNFWTNHRAANEIVCFTV